MGDDRSVVEDAARERESKRNEGVEADPHGTNGFLKKPSYFVVTIIVILVVFYIVAICFAFYAYKEFKTIAEENNEELNQGANIMAYGTLVPRH